ncbi:hypothetical protein RO3G_02928 [Rhizopus delemar RA 99-880]|uniref:Uncharacterized protein n=1 Tax=Rhizopus delemar (strain RA 99-880 / ATCC MYA-4621 / FGSC 9543 / NRRL 43880) TaxID=246409 RepID=I1BPU4_RHIO9|nr:hypothetical protein RO3G_02928 [Rhizopus delemar RA 99-880]|eukprot:EIE78224.1 hypothetical protein RO3G_02928 [Rhizopus delemar RA 99-880]
MDILDEKGDPHVIKNSGSSVIEEDQVETTTDVTMKTIPTCLIGGTEERL